MAMRAHLLPAVHAPACWRTGPGAAGAGCQPYHPPSPWQLAPLQQHVQKQAESASSTIACCLCITDAAADRTWAAGQGLDALPAPPRITAVGKVRFTSSRRSRSCSVTLTCKAAGLATRMVGQACRAQQSVCADRLADDMHTADPLQAVLTNRGSLLSCSWAARSLWACLSFLSKMSIVLLPTAQA